MKTERKNWLLAGDRNSVSQNRNDTKFQNKIRMKTYTCRRGPYLKNMEFI